MPANKKYLEKSVSQRIAKVSASVIGGFLVSAAFFMALATLLSNVRKEVFMTFYFGGFLLWMPLMIVPFLFRNGWKCWRIYLVAFAVFYSLTYLG